MQVGETLRFFALLGALHPAAAMAEVSPKQSITDFWTICSPSAPTERTTYDSVILQAYAANWAAKIAERSSYDPSEDRWHRTWAFAPDAGLPQIDTVVIEIASDLDRTVERCTVALTGIDLDELKRELSKVPDLDLLGDQSGSTPPEVTYGYLESRRQSLFVILSAIQKDGHSFSTLTMTRTYRFRESPAE